MLKTVTYDDTTHKVVPKIPDPVMMEKGSGCASAIRATNTGVLTLADASGIYQEMLSAAPELPASVWNSDMGAAPRDKRLWLYLDDSRIVRGWWEIFVDDQGDGWTDGTVESWGYEQLMRLNPKMWMEYFTPPTPKHDGEKDAT